MNILERIKGVLGFNSKIENESSEDIAQASLEVKQEVAEVLENPLLSDLIDFINNHSKFNLVEGVSEANFEKVLENDDLEFLLNFNNNISKYYFSDDRDAIFDRYNNILGTLEKKNLIVFVEKELEKEDQEYEIIGKFKEFNYELACQELTDDKINNLSLEELVDLLKDLELPANGCMHITRQGIRDHGLLAEHQVGKYSFFDSFKSLLESGTFKSPLMSRMDSGTLLRDFLQMNDEHVFNVKDEQELISSVKSILTSNYLNRRHTFDYLAMHFTSDNIHDSSYGCETGNEFFIYFPTSYIASQANFNPENSRFFETDSQSPVYKGSCTFTNNDLFVYKENGVDLGCGVVFIKENALVDSATGSKYSLDSNKELIIEEQRLSQAIEFCEDNKQNILELAQEGLSVVTEYLIDNLSDVMLEIDEIFVEDLISNLKFNYNDLRDVFISSRQFFRLAENPIRSQDYWENYFSENPESRPSKIFYYKSESPSEAYVEFLEKYGLQCTDDSSIFTGHGVESKIHHIDDVENFLENLEKHIDLAVENGDIIVNYTDQ
jgi:hypothetical protein